MRYRDAPYKRYRGRFAPSPTGPLHFGSLVTAVASYLQARVQQGEWIIRIEDIDPPREPRHASQSILQTLADYGFEWHSRPLYQRRQHNLHHYFAQQLLARDAAYPCTCRRKDLINQCRSGPMGTIYPGTCAAKPDTRAQQLTRYALRVRTDHQPISFTDRHFGEQHCDLKQDSGDYMIYRSDGLPSYILAVTVDDMLGGYTEIMRGADLLPITPRQVHLSQLLQRTLPPFFHLPVITDRHGDKLSKQNHAPALRKHDARSNLFFALQDLGQEPPQHLVWRPLSAIWEWAYQHWDCHRIPRQQHIVYAH